MNKTDLVEIKKGKTGKGLLIDNDGYVSLNEGKNRLIKEAVDSADGWYCPYPFRVSCILQRHSVKNANGRVYPEKILKREVENYQVLIDERRALGEADHPESSTISIKNISHCITEMHWEGITLVGELELNISKGFKDNGIVSTAGDMAANLILNGYKIGISSRAIGGVENVNGELVVDDSLELIGWDLVVTPSTKNAWLDTDYRNLQQYIEKEEKDDSKLISEKISKIKSLL